MEAGKARSREDEKLSGREAGEMGSYEGMKVVGCEDVKSDILLSSDCCILSNSLNSWRQQNLPACFSFGCRND